MPRRHCGTAWRGAHRHAGKVPLERRRKAVAVYTRRPTPSHMGRAAFVPRAHMRCCPRPCPPARCAPRARLCCAPACVAVLLRPWRTDCPAYGRMPRRYRGTAWRRPHRRTGKCRWNTAARQWQYIRAALPCRIWEGRRLYCAPAYIAALPQPCHTDCPAYGRMPRRHRGTAWRRAHRRAGKAPLSHRRKAVAAYTRRPTPSHMGRAAFVPLAQPLRGHRPGASTRAGHGGALMASPGCLFPPRAL